MTQKIGEQNQCGSRGFNNRGLLKLGWVEYKTNTGNRRRTPRTTELKLKSMEERYEDRKCLISAMKDAERSQDYQNPYTAKLEATAMALRCMPDGLQCRELTVLSSSQSSLKAIARPRQQSGQVITRQIYEHAERLRKGNNKIKVMWTPSRDDDLTMGREAKRRAQKATRAECTPQSLPCQARSTRTRLMAAQLRQQRRLPDRVGGHSKRIDRALQANTR
ncbi:hypothetical protein FOYG_17124 [Fusarium oxysporum NRRL 32931]|uniref:RNase H type-1 domain-containing protein n=1 Tax=Fusarium oxysporum NRRL 32931 TaxID=660029 RepID=W9HFE2_FUSOX|nr:hypothetical protein FOYG_17124 [Fusarium oxysporum NRRL 32931]